jgi:hypothetical protein
MRLPIVAFTGIRLGILIFHIFIRLVLDLKVMTMLVIFFHFLVSQFRIMLQIVRINASTENGGIEQRKKFQMGIGRIAFFIVSHRSEGVKGTHVFPNAIGEDDV